MRAFVFVSLLIHAFSSTYRIEDWLSAPPSITAESGEPLDSAEYQLILPPSVFHGVDGRKRDLTRLSALLQQQGVVVGKSSEEIRQVTLFNLSLMDPSQDQSEEETAWELKLRTTIDGKTSDIGLSDLTLKRGDVPENFDWYPDHIAATQAGAVDVENKFELDIQCAERDYTQATKLDFPRGTLPRIVVYGDLEFYFPKVFQTREIAARLNKKRNFRRMRLAAADVSFEWDATISGTVSGVNIDFVIGTRHKDYESAKEGEEGWAIRPPELNWRVKATKVSTDASKRSAFLADMQRIFNAFLSSDWNGHQDCGQWNGPKTCAPGFKLDGTGTCVSEGCSNVAAVTKIPRGAEASTPSFAAPAFTWPAIPFSAPPTPLTLFATPAAWPRSSQGSASSPVASTGASVLSSGLPSAATVGSQAATTPSSFTNSNSMFSSSNSVALSARVSASGAMPISPQTMLPRSSALPAAQVSSRLFPTPAPSP